MAVRVFLSLFAILSPSALLHGQTYTADYCLPIVCQVHAPPPVVCVQTAPESIYRSVPQSTTQRIPGALQDLQQQQDTLFQKENTTYLTVTNNSGNDRYFIIRFIDQEANPQDSGFFWLPTGKSQERIVRQFPQYIESEDAYMLQVLGYNDKLKDRKTWGYKGLLPRRLLNPKQSDSSLSLRLSLGGGTPSTEESTAE